jgi:hypothetical protein
MGMRAGGLASCVCPAHSIMSPKWRGLARPITSSTPPLRGSQIAPWRFGGGYFPENPDFKRVDTDSPTHPANQGGEGLKQGFIRVILSARDGA